MVPENHRILLYMMCSIYRYVFLIFIKEITKQWTILLPELQRSFLGWPFASDSIVTYVHKDSVGLGYYRFFIIEKQYTLFEKQYTLFPFKSFFSQWVFLCKSFNEALLEVKSNKIIFGMIIRILPFEWFFFLFIGSFQTLSTVVRTFYFLLFNIYQDQWVAYDYFLGRCRLIWDVLLEF